jgi:voltage-gated potassium channel
MAIVDDLAAVPLFDSLTELELKELAGWFDVQTVGEGVKLAGEGATGYSFYVLVEGSAVVTADELTVAAYAPGDFFGEMAILGGGRRTATVTTTSPARVLVMFGTEFRRMQELQPAVAARLEEAMKRRQQELLDLRSAASESG